MKYSVITRFPTRPFYLRTKFIVPVAIGITAMSLYAAPIVKNKLSSTPTYHTILTLESIEKSSGETLSTNSEEIKEPGEKALLPGAKWIPQTFNNCGPATTSMVLQYFGVNVDQNTTKAALRTNSDDKNVFTYEMHDYMRNEHNVQSKLLFNGNLTILKTLVANGFYVVVEDFLHSNDDIGHVTIIRGYDDKLGVLIADDSYLGTNIMYKYDEFDQKQWKPFNREYLPVYKTEQEEILKKIIGENWDENEMFRNSVKNAQAEIDQDPNNPYGWFNLGTSYYGLKQYEKAAEAFEKSKSLGWPKKMLWYQIQPVQANIEIGEYQKALELIQLGLAGNDSFAELHYEAARAYNGLGDNQKAKEEAEKAIFYSPNYEPAKNIISSL